MPIEFFNGGKHETHPRHWLTSSQWHPTPLTELDHRVDITYCNITRYGQYLLLGDCTQAANTKQLICAATLDRQVSLKTIICVNVGKNAVSQEATPQRNATYVDLARISVNGVEWHPTPLTDKAEKLL